MEGAGVECRSVGVLECWSARALAWWGGGRGSAWLSYNGSVAITVLLFASVAERAGARRLELSWCEGDTVGSVRDRLFAAYPQVAPFAPTLLYALDEEYVRATDVVRDGATLALIPPVSGG